MSSTVEHLALELLIWLVEAASELDRHLQPAPLQAVLLLQHCSAHFGRPEDGLAKELSIFFEFVPCPTRTHFELVRNTLAGAQPQLVSMKLLFDYPPFNLGTLCYPLIG